MFQQGLLRLFQNKRLFLSLSLSEPIFIHMKGIQNLLFQLDKYKMSKIKLIIQQLRAVWLSIHSVYL